MKQAQYDVGGNAPGNTRNTVNVSVYRKEGIHEVPYFEVVDWGGLILSGSPDVDEFSSHCYIKSAIEGRCFVIALEGRKCH